MTTPTDPEDKDRERARKVAESLGLGTWRGQQHGEEEIAALIAEVRAEARREGARDEREACAQVAERRANDANGYGAAYESVMARSIAAAIRARED